MKPHLRQLLVVGTLAIAAAAFTSGCLFSARARAQPVDAYYSTSSEVYVAEPMPPPRVEVVTVAPYAGMYWVDGYWQWGGNSYVWVTGRWDRPSQPGYVWLAPRYESRSGRHVYVHGAWAPPTVRVRGSVHGTVRQGRGHHRGPPARRGHR